MNRISIWLFLLMFLFSCKKEEGFGGLATIQGKVFGKNYNSNGNLVSQNYLGEVKVYISQHDNPAYLERLYTSYDGSYKFQYLQKGTYDIWVFGDCDYCSWDQTYVLKTVEITSKKQVVELEDFVITF